MSFPLPDGLAYLEPVLAELASVPVEELNEDTDNSTLESAFRMRIDGMTVGEAKRCLEEDRSALQDWLAVSGDPDNPAYWIVGYLMRPGYVARDLILGCADDDPQAPHIAFDPPPGWTVELSPFSIGLVLGECLGTITIIDDFSLEFMPKQWDAGLALDHVSGWTEDVQFGECVGTKYVFSDKTDLETGMDYFLRVPGGAVHCQIRTGGEPIDLGLFEAKLATLSIGSVE